MWKIGHFLENGQFSTFCACHLGRNTNTYATNTIMLTCGIAAMKVSTELVTVVLDLVDQVARNQQQVDAETQPKRLQRLHLQKTQVDSLLEFLIFLFSYFQFCVN